MKHHNDCPRSFSTLPAWVTPCNCSDFYKETQRIEELKKQPPYTGADDTRAMREAERQDRIHDDERRGFVSAAAEAQERFGDDELERTVIVHRRNQTFSTAEGRARKIIAHDASLPEPFGFPEHEGWRQMK